jgi:regulator of protease activity HflC (stomatin/prohibitin superfamily)
MRSLDRGTVLKIVPAIVIVGMVAGFIALGRSGREGQAVDVGSLIWIVVALLVVALLVFLAWSSVRVVREYQRLVVFRLGRVLGARGPGLVLMIPFVDRPVRVDLREQFMEVPHQTCITRDNAPVNVDFLIYMYVVDSVSSVVQVQNYIGAAQGIATTTLRAVVGDISLDDVLAKREQINTLLRTKLDEVTERWGVKVTTVEIREIIPPREVQDAMNRQMSAERNRRAVVTEADGKRDAAIAVATGEKQAAILASEGARQSAILRAEGFALALETVFTVAKTVDTKTMGLQYLDTLKALGNSPSTKFVLPMEFTSMLQPLVSQLGASTAAPPATEHNGTEHNGRAIQAPSVPPQPRIAVPDDREPRDQGVSGPSSQP